MNKVEYQVDLLFAAFIYAARETPFEVLAIFVNRGDHNADKSVVCFSLLVSPGCPVGSSECASDSWLYPPGMGLQLCRESRQYPKDAMPASVDEARFVC